MGSVAIVERVRRFLAKIAPYVLVEILLPGGTLIALVVYLHRSGRLVVSHHARAAARARPAIVRVFGAVAAAHS